MTFEEIQKVIEGMLAVQRDIQEKQIKTTETLNRVSQQQIKTTETLERVSQQQIKNSETIDRLSIKIENLTENVSNLNIVSQRHQDRFGQFYGYHQSAETERLQLLENQRRLEKIEDKLDAR